MGLLAMAVFCFSAAVALGQPARGFREVDVLRDVQYGKPHGHALLLDIYGARKEGRHPAVVIIHGGAFRAGDKRQPGGLAQGLAREGFVVFSVNYRLAPEFRYPAGLDDVQRAVRWIRRNAGKYGVDPERIGAIGHSAGSYYAAMLAFRETRRSSEPELAGYSSRVSCAVLYYGLYDLASAVTGEVNAVSQKRIVEDLLGKTLEEAPELWKEASPITYAANAPPLYLFHGTGDTSVSPEQSRRLHETLEAAGKDVTYLELEGAGHGWPPFSPFGRRSESECVRFLKEHLSR